MKRQENYYGEDHVPSLDRDQVSRLIGWTKPSNCIELDRIYTRREVEDMLGISTSTFYRRVRYGLPVVRFSLRRIGIRASDLGRWLNDHTSRGREG
jgi:predicted DNA-binding transcriptional regulator AlpA